MKNPGLFVFPSVFICLLFLISADAHDAETKASSTRPYVEGPIPVTESSYPFNAAGRTNTPQDLSKAGYVEEEYFVSGLANVYDFDPEGKVIVKTADAHYATRILVRRPESAKKFSGTIIVELLNPTAMYDLDLEWQFSRDYFIANNDIWVGITSKPVAVKALKTFDPDRYGSLSWENPLPPDKTCPDPVSFLPDTTPGTENGLVWDITTQVGAMLRSAEKSPLKGFSAKTILLTGYSQTGGYVAAYINFIRPLDSARLLNGRPVYDGYLIGDGDALIPGLNQCSKPPEKGDPRLIVKPCPQPVISINSQSLLGISSAVRRPDSDSAADRYRRYEVPGASHINKRGLDLSLNPEDALKAGITAKLPECKEIKTYGITDFPFEYFMNGAFANLKAWVQSGKAPAKTALISIKTVPGVQFPVAETDKYGNAEGGLRSPYIDVPVAAYYANSTPEDPSFWLLCSLCGYKVPFKKEVLNKLYPKIGIYNEKVKKSVAWLVKNRLITIDDGERIIREAAGFILAQKPDKAKPKGK